MKKLSTLIAMLLCVTIGGVYAAWTYAGTNDIADSFAEAKVTITDVELTGANGAYHIASNLVLTIDQKNDEHEAELVFASNNAETINVTVTFTPSANAPLDVKKNGVASEMYFGVSTPMQYKMDAEGNYSETGTPKDIFTFLNDGNGILDNVFTWTKWVLNEETSQYEVSTDEEELGAYFTYTIDEAFLRANIKLNDNNGDTPFVLDTKEEHDAFRVALGGNIVVRVTDGTVN